MNTGVHAERPAVQPNRNCLPGKKARDFCRSRCPGEPVGFRFLAVPHGSEGVVAMTSNLSVMPFPGISPGLISHQ